MTWGEAPPPGPNETPWTNRQHGYEATRYHFAFFKQNFTLPQVDIPN